MRIQLAILMLALPVSRAEGQKVPLAPKTTTEYDRIRDRTVVTFGRFTYGSPIPMGYGVSTKELALMVTYETPGQTEIIPDSVTLRFVVTGLRSLNWQLTGDRDLYILVGDSLRVRIPATKYDTAVVSANRFENVYFRIPLLLLQSMATSMAVEGAIADHRFSLSELERAALLSFIQGHKRPQ
jgi:hypothetical protein